jgi:[ribosomal protein S5]-alanine N-acetyltransferase
MIGTLRLNLRELTLADLAAIHELHSLPETDEFNTLGIPADIQVTEKLLHEWLAEQKERRTKYVLAVEKSGTHEFIGLMGMNLGEAKYRVAEVWYKTHVKHWGQGYTSEALGALLGFAFNTLKLHRVEAGCAVENHASIRVLEKAGLIREGRKRKKLPIRGQWVDNYFYAILEEDFLK